MIGNYFCNFFFYCFIKISRTLCDAKILKCYEPFKTPKKPSISKQYSLQIMTMESRGMIESAAVCFFTQVMSCHVMNQLLFAKVLCEVIKEQSSSSKSGMIIIKFPGPVLEFDMFI